MSVWSGRPDEEKKGGESTRRTGSRTSSHSDDLLSENSPPMKFLVVPPVALVPFQWAEICSAFGWAREPRALRGAEVAKERTRRGMRERTDMVQDSRYPGPICDVCRRGIVTR